MKKHIYSCQKKDYKCIDVMSKNDPLIHAFMKHFTSLRSIPGRNAVNSQTFYFSILETILERF